MKRQTLRFLTLTIAVLSMLSGGVLASETVLLATGDAGRIADYTDVYCMDLAYDEDLVIEVTNIKAATLGDNQEYRYELYKREIVVNEDGIETVEDILMRYIDVDSVGLYLDFNFHPFFVYDMPITMVIKRFVSVDGDNWVESAGERVFTGAENEYFTQTETHCVNELPITGEYHYADGRTDTYTFHYGEEGVEDKLEYTFYEDTELGCIREYTIKCELVDVPIVEVEPLGEICLTDGQLVINYSIMRGNPTSCHITFDEVAHNAGYKDLDVELNETNTITLDLVSTQCSEYGINLQFFNNSSVEECQSDVYSQHFAITLGGYVHEKWTDVLFVDNNDKNCTPECDNDLKFNAYQWYKNGKLLEGETGQYYYEEGGLNGVYYVVLTDTLGNEYRTCEIERRLTIDEDGNIVPLRIAPVPVDAGQIVNIDTDRNGELRVVDMTGRTIATALKQTDNFNLNAPQKAGAYVITFKDEEGRLESVKLIVK